MYIHEHSGHHQAAIALEKAFRDQRPLRVQCLLVDALRYTHPILEKFIRRTYLEIIKKNPQVWEYLYDNPLVLKSTLKLKKAVQQAHSRRLEKLISKFDPTDVVCTQAFPCGIISDFKTTRDFKAPLYAVLTDYLPHSYWLKENVARYFVPCKEAKERLIAMGVFETHISITGIPIEAAPANPKTKIAAFSKEKATPLILVMGGSQGLGPIEKIVLELDCLEENFEIIVLTGKNKKLFGQLNHLKKKLLKKLRAIAYTENVMPYFKLASVLVSKPGGLTIAQALASKVPLIFINPIPGQEANNAFFLLKNQAALEARSEKEVAQHVGQLLRFPAKMRLMKRNMGRLAYPAAASDIVRQILNQRRPADG